MPDHVLPINFRFSLVLESSAPDALQEVARLYWEHDGVDADTNDIVWTRKTRDIDFKRWAGTAHIAAAAGGEAVSESFVCTTCNQALSLSSRQVLSDAQRGRDVRCRACDGRVNERARTVLDPKTHTKRQRRVDEEQREATVRAIREKAASEHRLLEEKLEGKRRVAIEETYPPVTDDDGGCLAEDASIAARIGALAIIHIAGTDEGLIGPVRYNDALIAPSSELAHDLFVAAWRSALLVIHPTSPSDAFVWKEREPDTLDGRIYIDRIRFAAPGKGPLARRLKSYTDCLRDYLDLESMWSIQRRELRELSRTLVAEETIRYFRHTLADHGFPDPAQHHLEALRSHARRGASYFSLGQLYRMAWSSGRDAASAYERIRGMNREKAAAHAVNRFAEWISRAIDAPDRLGEHFREAFGFPLSAATDVVFRIIFGVNPMRALPTDIDAMLEGSPDEELRLACDQSIPDRTVVLDWLRTDPSWSPEGFRVAIERVSKASLKACAPCCAHERAPITAHHAGGVYDRIVARVGDQDAVLVTAEATSIGNQSDYHGRAGDLALALIARQLGWRPNHDL
ncbi:hypothetical protein [Corynebacterium glyciniphilum]|uniref:hypothetical protein n=1 Tax=Corynebacterium glyciniphilum TaxID=1404244 RepID=UPI003FD2129B